MSKFNKVANSPKSLTINEAGGMAYLQSPELALVSILLTSFVSDQFYKKADTQLNDLKALISKCDPLFVAKAAIYARTKFGMRSISHVAASELAKHIGGKPWGKNFYKAVINRPDDITEILSYHINGKQKLSNAMRKGLAAAFDQFNAYTLAKYRGDNNSMKLLDAVNLLHPVPTEKNAEALKALMKGELKSFDTWETELSKAGQTAETEDEKLDLKGDAWTKLIKEKKIGYFALLKNLRNIIEQAPGVLDEAIAMLVDPERIKKSLVLPFRYTNAYDEVAKLTNTGVRKVLRALSDAVDLSLVNVPKFAGNTLVVLDKSGSMDQVISGKTTTPAKIGALFAAVLVKASDADLICFSDDANYVNVNTNDSTITIANSIKFASGGTNFHAIFKTANKKYDRIIILSDMQGWIGHHTPKEEFNRYKAVTKADPFVYSFDLQGYGTMQFPEQKTFCIAGFSGSIFNVMEKLELDKKALVNEIASIQL